MTAETIIQMIASANLECEATSRNIIAGDAEMTAYYANRAAAAWALVEKYANKMSEKEAS